ncbi:hypothetical protein BC629DRAFT_1446730 [Irpex lacteus]|nr:hypothetical protein BC629DRAFT_1446730 [Irpex lacteus]
MNTKSSSFQQAVVRSVNEKNTQMQKELHNVFRDANGEIGLQKLQRELETERRKTATLQEAVRERDKEYQKLKAQHDKTKRKAILAPENPQVTPTLATGRAVPQAQAQGTGFDRHPFNSNAHNPPFRSATTVSDQSDSGNEVEMLIGNHPVRL